MSRAHERYRQTDDRRTGGRQQIADVNVSSVIEIRSSDTTSTRTELQRIDHAVVVQKKQ